jgi:hypothetical protein
VQVSDQSQVSLLVGFEEQAGRLYSGVLLRAPPDGQLHRYGREVEEMVLSRPSAHKSPDSPLAGGNSQDSLSSRTSSDRQNSNLEIDKLSQGEVRELKVDADVTSLGLELIATDATADQTRSFRVTTVDKGSWAEKQNIRPGDEVMEINDRKAADLDDQEFKVAWNSRPLDLKLFTKANPMRETEWPFLLMYAVKEGVLLFFSSELAECEEVVREVARSFGQKSYIPEDMTMKPAQGTKVAANLTAALRAKCVEHRVGRTPPAVTRTITEVIVNDLKRRFAVKCDAEEQPDCTNCCAFCLRNMMAMQLAVRGYDIRTVCDSRSDLGPKAGETACAAWESLWRSVRV